MQFLKLTKVNSLINIKNFLIKHKTKIYMILFILLLPVWLIVLKVIMIFTFQIGKYTGTFIRAIYELVLKNV